MTTFLTPRWNLLFILTLLYSLCAGCYRQSENASGDDLTTRITSTLSSTNMDQSPPSSKTPMELHTPETIVFQSYTQTQTSTQSPTTTPSPTLTHRPAIDFELIGQFGGTIHALEIQDTLLYIAVGMQVIVFDISNPWNPHYVGKSDILDSIVVDVALAEELAYVVSREGTLYALNLSDPPGLTTVGTIQIRHEPTALEVNDYHVFITQHQCIRQNGGPCHYVGGLQIIDVSNPAHMREAAFVEKDGGFNDIIIKDTYAYVTGAEEGLTIFDISNPSLPYPMGNEPSVFGPMSLIGEYAYIDNSNASAAIVDVSDPAAPVVVTDSLGRCTGALAFFDDYIYNLFSRCYSMETGLEVIEAPGGLAKNENGVVNVIGRILDRFEVSGDPEIVIQGKIAYATGTSGIQVIDLNDPTNPVVLKHLLMPGHIDDVAMYEGFAYVLHNDSNGLSPLYILDVSQPSNISPQASVYNIPLRSKGLPQAGLPQTFYLNIAIEGDFAYIMVSEPEGLGVSRFSILDLSQPLQPEPVWENEIQLGYNGLAFSGSLAFAYTPRSDRVTIYNISDPTNPFIEGTIPNTGSIEVLEVIGDLAYVWTAGEGFKIYDWSNLQSPQLISELALEGHAWSLVVKDDIALVSQGSILAVDVSDPLHPHVIVSFELPASVGNFTIVDGYLYASGGQEGLLIFRVIY